MWLPGNWLPKSHPGKRCGGEKKSFWAGLHICQCTISDTVEHVGSSSNCWACWFILRWTSAAHCVPQIILHPPASPLLEPGAWPWWEAQPSTVTALPILCPALELLRCVTVLLTLLQGHCKPRALQCLLPGREASAAGSFLSSPCAALQRGLL